MASSGLDSPYILTVMDLGREVIPHLSFLFCPLASCLLFLPFFLAVVKHPSLNPVMDLLAPIMGPGRAWEPNAFMHFE